MIFTIRLCREGIELIHLLYSKTGVPVLKPIVDLEFAKTRFTGVIEKSEMAACVKDFADK